MLGFRSKKLENCDKNTPLFSLNDINMFGKIVSNYDGDTCDIVLDVPFIKENTRFKCRLNGIDCAEIRSKDSTEKKHAKRAKKFVEDWHRGNIVYVKCYKFDKFGRLLADVYKGKEYTRSLSEHLLEAGLAYRYSGKTKKKFREWADPRHWQSKKIIHPSPIPASKNLNNILDYQ